MNNENDGGDHQLQMMMMMISICIHVGNTSLEVIDEHCRGSSLEVTDGMTEESSCRHLQYLWQVIGAQEKDLVNYEMHGQHTMQELHCKNKL